MDRNSERGDYSADSPVYSRLFVVCEKHTTEETLKNVFSAFGVIEDVKMPRDRTTGECRGVAYIKFSKTSEAAAALESLNQSVLPGGRRPIKVMVAANRSDVQMGERDDPNKYKRLFINVPRVATENDIEDIFKEFGHIRTTIIQRDRQTGESRGFAYVTFDKFSEAAKAFENCERQYRPLFAAPKGLGRRQETSFESNIDYIAKSYTSTSSSMPPDNQHTSSRHTSLSFVCCPILNQWHVEKLFDIVPGLVSCKFYVDLVRNIGKGSVTYSNAKSAAHALEKINEFEYPPGNYVYVTPENSKYNPLNEPSISTKVSSTVSKLKNAIELSAASSSPDLAELAKAIAEASNLIKKATGGGLNDSNVETNDLNYCSVKLPPPKPLADIDSTVAKRCFLVCKPSPPPLTVLRDIFCRFGDLINVYTLPNKTVGYARYASAAAADEAIKMLHGAEICGVRIKVIEAEDEVRSKKRRFDGPENEF